MRQCHAPHLTLRHFEACHVCNMLELHTAITGSGAFWRSSNSKYNDSVCCENRDGEMSRSNIANLVLSPIENQGIRCVYISISKLQWSCRCQPSLVQLAYNLWDGSVEVSKECFQERHVGDVSTLQHVGIHTNMPMQILLEHGTFWLTVTLPLQSNWLSVAMAQLWIIGMALVFRCQPGINILCHFHET